MDPVADIDGLPGMSADDVAALLRFINWKHRDDVNAAIIRRVVADNLTPILDAFYEHLGSFPPLAHMLGDEAKLKGLKATQGAYLRGLGEGIGTPEYAQARFRIGLAHDRVNLAPRWFIGAYAKLVELIAGYLPPAVGDDPQVLLRTLMTLRKIVQVDSILAIEAYHHAAVARQGALLAEVDRARHRLEELVRIDVLTGVSSRRGLLESLGAELERSRRYHHPLTVLFLDIDRFKAINDLCGHAAGDEVLRHVGHILKESVRPADVIGRYGGEEFVVGLVECPPETAWDIAERLRAMIEATARNVLDLPVAVTVSIGMASVAPNVATLDALLARADAAMYRAKSTGRNRVCNADAAPVAA